MLNVTLSVLGALTISLGSPWLDGGLVAVRHQGQLFSSACQSVRTPGSCAPLHHATSIEVSSGSDAIGLFVEESLAWSTTAGGDTPLFVTGVRTYATVPDVYVATQHFPQGLLPGIVNGTDDEVVSAFPTLGRSHVDLGVVVYEGVQLQNTRTFRWSAGSEYGVEDPGSKDPKPPDANGGNMPLVLTASDGSTLVASPLDDFFTACQTPSKELQNFSFGMQQTLASAPAGHTHATLLVAAAGVRSAMMRWGTLLLLSAGGGKERSMKWTEQGDAGLRSLSYYTDNGAFYYYQTAEGKEAMRIKGIPQKTIAEDGTSIQLVDRALYERVYAGQTVTKEYATLTKHFYGKEVKIQAHRTQRTVRPMCMYSAYSLA